MTAARKRVGFIALALSVAAPGDVATLQIRSVGGLLTDSRIGVVDLGALHAAIVGGLVLRDIRLWACLALQSQRLLGVVLQRGFAVLTLAEPAPDRIQHFDNSFCWPRFWPSEARRLAGALVRGSVRF